MTSLAINVEAHRKMIGKKFLIKLLAGEQKPFV